MWAKIAENQNFENFVLWAIVPTPFTIRTKLGNWHATADPQCMLTCYRAFSVAGPIAWNLPPDTQHVPLTVSGVILKLFFLNLLANTVH